ncbi:MAG TPA: pirin family protein [Acidimicrobiales bacterium]|nr:pirin family protein [Acidimicrobiales bacterium]
MQSPVLQTVPLGRQWGTADPFLFCVHHLDHYPAANEHMGPAAALDARDIGMDFSGSDGWSMYHGSIVPGFPQHPHRGFETVTYVRQGFIDHSDSLGATARFGRGDVQWLTAGAGIVHCEMFPLLDRTGPNTTELFQIWLNLPSGDKMVDPYFTMQWNEEIPRLALTDDEGRRGELTVIAGAIEGVRPLAAPPDSYASRADSDLAIWHLVLEPLASWVAPPAASGDATRTLYAFEGSVSVAEQPVTKATGVVVRPLEPIVVTAGPQGAEVLLLQGRPIGEPVAQYGPFVMNDRAGIEKALQDYQATGFGGWPWPTDDPVQPRGTGRFALHADGRLEDRSGADTKQPA